MNIWKSQTRNTMSNFDRINRIAIALCVCNWIFGLGVIQYPFGNIYPTVSLIYSSIFIVSYCSISAVAYPHVIKWSVDMGKMGLSVKLLFYSKIILTVGVIVLARYRSEGTFKNIKKAMMINDMIERIGANINDKKVRITYIRKLLTYGILVSATIVIYAASIAIGEEPLYAKITVGITLCYPLVLMFITDMTFVISVSIIGYKYHVLNKTLKSILTNNEPDMPRHKRLVIHLTNEDHELTSNTNIHTVNNPMGLIKLTKTIHLELTKMGEEINDTYGPQLLLSIVAALVNITGNVYVTYMLLQDGYKERNLAFEYIIISTVFTLYYAIKISIFTRACSHCKENATKTGELLNKYYDDPFANEEVQSEIRDFNVQLIQRPVKFTVAGYISLDTRLMQRMITTITTYLMILIQLEEAET